MTPRFVILHHTGYGREHWDLMIEQDDSLATWKLYHHPGELPKKAWEVFRIADHRKAYLDYEGPVSAGRGQVRRFCRGTYVLLKKNSQLWQVKFTADGLTGLYELKHLKQDRWLISQCRSDD